MSDSTGQDRRMERLVQLVAPDSCALLLQEVQEGVVGESSRLPALAAAAGEVGMVEHVGAVAAAARRAGVPVVHCTADSLPGGFGANRNARLFAAARKAGRATGSGGEWARPVAAVGPAPEDIVLPRYHGLSPMTGTQLDQLLRNGGRTTVVVTGVSLNVAIPNLVFDAVNRGYQVVLVTDAVAGTPVDYGPAIIEHSLSLVATLTGTQELVGIWQGQGRAGVGAGPRATEGLGLWSSSPGGPGGADR